MANQPITPFLTHEDAIRWARENCNKCAKSAENYSRCAIEHALVVDYLIVGDGIPFELAIRMGRLDHPRNEMFTCHEFLPAQTVAG